MSLENQYEIAQLQSLHWVMSISKIVQCWQMSSKLTLDIGDLKKYNPTMDIKAKLCLTAAGGGPEV